MARIMLNKGWERLQKLYDLGKVVRETVEKMTSKHQKV